MVINLLCCSFGNVLVSTFAAMSSVEQYLKVISPFSTHSRTKWCCTSMCFVWACCMRFFVNILHLGCHIECHNLSFGLTTKAKGLEGCGPKRSPGVKAKSSQGCGPRRSLGVTSHTPESVRKCEGIWGSEPSHSQSNSQGTPTLGDGISVDFQNFREWF